MALTGRRLAASIIGVLPTPPEIMAPNAIRGPTIARSIDIIQSLSVNYELVSQCSPLFDFRTPLF